MRLGVTIGELNNGRWEVLAMPDVSIADQRRLVKDIKLNHGKIEGKKGDKQLKRVIFYDNFSKRAKFEGSAPAIATPPETVV